MAENIAYLKQDDEKNKIYSLGHFTTIGRDSTCLLQLGDTRVSDRHARIEINDNKKYIIKDLRSQNGTFVNGTRVLEAELSESDIIKIGENEFEFTFHRENSKYSFDLTSKNNLWAKELKVASQAAQTNYPMLLLGESGTGKDILAQSIHKFSQRLGPMVSVNCSALTETLIESELFGHVKGSFTGAVIDRKGAFEAARGGTLFLDEIGDLAHPLQAKLLRALDNNEIRPVGSDRIIKTDVRIIAATHQNLIQRIKEKTFRSDLYFRLNVVTIKVPTLKDRVEDFETLLYLFAREMRVRFSYLAIERLKNHTWPGNIRELKNLVSRASAFYPKIQIDESIVEHLLDQISSEESDSSLLKSTGSNPSVIKELEKQLIFSRLEANLGNQRKTAQELGMPKSTLNDRIRNYSIDVTKFKKRN